MNDIGTGPEFYHAGMRQLQNRYEGRAIPDRLEQHRMRRTFNDEDRRFIESAPFFFLSTASATSVDCSSKGGAPGFVRVTGDTTLAWPDYDGNRIYRSLGYILENGLVLREGYFRRRRPFRQPGHQSLDKPNPMPNSHSLS